MFLLKSYIIHAYISSFILHQQFYYWLITIYVVHIYSDNISNFNRVLIGLFFFQCLNQHVTINNKNAEVIKFIRYTRKVEKPKCFKVLGVSKPKSINRIDKITERIAQILQTIFFKCDWMLIFPKSIYQVQIKTLSLWLQRNYEKKP